MARTFPALDGHGVPAVSYAVSDDVTFFTGFMTLPPTGVMCTTPHPPLLAGSLAPLVVGQTGIVALETAGVPAPEQGSAG